MTYFGNGYKGKKVLVAGHTGFKGSWLTLWLQQLGAEVVGVSKDIPTQPNHFELLNLKMTSITADITDYAEVLKIFRKHKPEIVFHLAAQALVRKSYQFPQETFATNLMGTVNILEACRNTESVRAVEVITSDKCYENQEWVWGYRENDLLGGHDPYSASKACAEVAISAYRRSFFPVEKYADHGVLVTSCRAGNVIGGGDWAKDRLIPDLMRGAAKHEVTPIRNPKATRPWQHVLEPLSGYLHLGSQLLKGKTQFAQAWNFGPNDVAHLSVQYVLSQVRKIWPDVEYHIKADAAHHEEKLLKLDCSKAYQFLEWHKVWSNQETFTQTVEWYKNYYQNDKILTLDQLHLYQTAAQQAGLKWTRSTT